MKQQIMIKQEETRSDLHVNKNPVPNPLFSETKLQVTGIDLMGLSWIFGNMELG